MLLKWSCPLDSVGASLLCRNTSVNFKWDSKGTAGRSVMVHHDDCEYLC